MKAFYRYMMVTTVLLALAAVTAAAGDRFASDRARWLSTEEQCKPVLNVTEVEPVSIVEAMLRCGMYDEARSTMIDYWGGMVRKGADTFWEVYDPDDEFRAPYGFYLLNSYCHAWSPDLFYFQIS